MKYSLHGKQYLIYFKTEPVVENTEFENTKQINSKIYELKNIVRKLKIKTKQEFENLPMLAVENLTVIQIKYLESLGVVVTENIQFEI